ncbi:PH domain-containing protein, partial [Candidatus Parcubacteria bacterium]|nr:PH domain-containing protein [Candidatus Parcubacteria bacterium]
HIILRLHKHVLILIGQLIPFAILDYLPYLLPRLGEFLAQTTPAATIDFVATFSFENPWVAFIVGMYWLFVWMGAFGTFTNHFLDQWIVTNERVIAINQKSFWDREVSSLFLHRIQNVETDVEGFFHTLFHFGTLSVESAGAELNRIRITGLPNPDQVRNRILQEVARHEKEKLAAVRL